MCNTGPHYFFIFAIYGLISFMAKRKIIELDGLGKRKSIIFAV